MDTTDDDPVMERAAADAAAMPDRLDIRQVADLLSVSPQYVTGLIARGEFAAGGTADARRVGKQDVLAWLQQSLRRRQQALDELVAETEALGLYGEPPPRRPGTDVGR